MSEFEFFPINEGDTVVCLGAWQGRSVIPISKKVGQSGLVIAVEPVIENYQELIKSIIREGTENIIPVLLAIGRRTTRGFIKLAPQDGSGSMTHSMVFDKGDEDRVTSVVSWKDLVEMLCLDHVDLCVVDIEGAEIQLLQGMTKVFPDKMVIEAHLWLVEKSKRGPWEAYFKELLKEKGYQIVKRERYNFYVKRV